mmetsp:Transcript_104288/g.222969  ORF Transcript_104288/g.222969 Transcript_104288/m.222969 type:complete len:213 (+) Transcript_104288:740-1378(+)
MGAGRSRSASSSDLPKKTPDEPAALALPFAAGLPGSIGALPGSIEGLPGCIDGLRGRPLLSRPGGDASADLPPNELAMLGAFKAPVNKPPPICMFPKLLGPVALTSGPPEELPPNIKEPKLPPICMLKVLGTTFAGAMSLLSDEELRPVHRTPPAGAAEDAKRPGGGTMLRPAGLTPLPLLFSLSLTMAWPSSTPLRFATRSCVRLGTLGPD